MGLLNRYHKPGGFLQLIKLVETSPKDKKEKFLSLIHDENPQWCESIKTKMLTLDRVCEWPESQLQTVTKQLQALTLVVLKESLSEDNWKNIENTLSERQIKNLNEQAEYKSPSTAGEKNTAHIQLLSAARRLLSEGYIYPDQFDASLVIEDDIEELLQIRGQSSSNIIPIQEEDELRDLSEVELRAKVRKLQRDNENLAEENAKLKSLVAKFSKSA